MIRFDGITIDRRRRAITRDGSTIFLPPVMFRFACALLLAKPKTASELFALVYRDREDGGPLDARASVQVRLHLLRPKLAALGIEVKAERTSQQEWKQYSAVVRPWPLPYLEAAE